MSEVAGKSRSRHGNRNGRSRMEQQNGRGEAATVLKLVYNIDAEIQMGTITMHSSGAART